MTAALHPTPTRVQLLADVAAGRVTGQARQWWHADGTKVTAAIREQQRAGWVAPGEPPCATDRPSTATAHPTPAGRAVLSAAGRCGSCGASTVAPAAPVAAWATACGCVYGHCRSAPACASWGVCGSCLLGGGR